MNCPSCWRPIEFEEKYSKVLSCMYCNTILEFWSWELTEIWKQSNFIEFPSIFKVWKEVEWNSKKVYVKWQLRYEYDWGFFDKFFVIIEWKEYYIEEDDGSTKLLSEWKWQKSNETIMDKKVWQYTNILWNNIFVQETWLFKLVNLKWFVDNYLVPWKSYEYLNWIIDWKMVYIEKEEWRDRIRVINEVK
jgi:hypothetical protein